MYCQNEGKQSLDFRVKNCKVAKSLITSQASRWFINEAMHYPQGERHASSVFTLGTDIPI